ncbi:nuclear pore complex protein NUP160 [Andrographis paniculata]|uniref:nuclear pore complex protein NUP160 n=1 Tax=Andrographis paniculata TaxID=175694 RepID=UPI0021E88247|nr:nuclear pore complex protein NUP160 [Andrographis paniculata]
MGSSSRWRMAGMEAPLRNTDSIEWRQVSVPSSSSGSTPSTLENSVAKDFASCCAIGDSPTYVIWKTSKAQPNFLEIIELSSSKELSRSGLRLIFPDSIFPFAFIYRDESNSSVSRNHFVLYTLTISGVAYCITLKKIFDYGTSSQVSADDIIEYNTQIQPGWGTITAVTAAEGCMLIGRSDGSIGFFQLGTLDPSNSGFVYELRDDAGFGRLWGILSRSPTLAAVQDLALSDVLQRKLLFVLHSDGSFRVWDLSSRSKIFSHAMTIPTPSGAFINLWVGETANNIDIIPFAVLHKENLEVSTATLFLYCLRCHVGNRVPLSLETSSRKISLGEGELIDVKVTSDKVWILKEEGLIMQDLFCDDTTEGLSHYYALQENFIADLLFQSSEHSPDDLLWLAHSTFSSSKEEVIPFISSVFMRVLLFPGVYCGTVLRRTLEDYNKYFTDSEFVSFTIGGLKAEILSIIEHQSGIENPVAILQCWKNMCSRYINNWLKYNASCGLLMDPSTGAVGVVRNNTISLCRGLEDAEHIIYGSFEERNSYLSPGLVFSDDKFNQKILFELLQCVRSVSQQLGKASSAVFYELLVKTPQMSPEDVVVRVLKVLETGHGSSTSVRISELGADTAWEKELSNHKNLRKFSANMFLSLHALCQKANSWSNVLNVVESYLNFLVPQKVVLNVDAETILGVNYSAIVQSVSQISKVMFESVLDVLMLLSYMTGISGQINMSQEDVSKVKLELIPMIHEIVTEWHIIHFFGTTPSESLAIEDFSYQLSSLQIDSNVDKRLWNGKLGKCEYPLAYVLLLSMQSSCGQMRTLPANRFQHPSTLISLTREFSSWIIWGSTDDSSVFFSNAIDLALVLLRHGQYNATEYLLALVDAYSRKEKTFGSLQSVDDKLSVLLHLLGCCLVAQTQHGLHGPVKDKKVGEALRCFFRAASVEGSSEVLRSLPHEAGWLRIDFSTSASVAEWKLQYYQWVMQLFEQYNLSDAACQFALAALEQVDEALSTMNSSSSEDFLETVTTVKGRLWANVFKFTLDLNNYHDAYCAIISNPDEESKNISLRRLVFVLYERGAVKILCNGQLPLIGLADKVERELAWKAERTDISTKPNPFKLLYAFEMHRQNWRKAASYIYLYSLRLRAESTMKDHQTRSSMLQERLNGLAAAVNSLQLVHPSYAWIDSPVDETLLGTENYPNKRARITEQGQSTDDISPQKRPSYLDVEKLEKEFTLTSAEYVLSLAGVKWTFSGTEKPSAELIDQLVESNSYDMAFTVILKFWKGSGLKRELERVFIAMALKCRPSRQISSMYGKNRKMYGLLLTSSEDEAVHDSLDAATTAQQFEGSGHWETLEFYLDKYRLFHPRLPLIVAGTLLSADSQIELPLWLVRHFKGDRSGSGFGMSGGESDPASLFRLYVDYGRHAEATNLLVEYMESLGALRPADVIRRKKTFAVWFPYTSIERLWCMLEESIKVGHRIDQSEKLKKLLHGVLLNHLNLLKVDSDDIRSSAS